MLNKDFKKVEKSTKRLSKKIIKDRKMDNKKRLDNGGKIEEIIEKLEKESKL